SFGNQLARLLESKYEPQERDARRRELLNNLEQLQAKFAERFGLVAQTLREQDLTLGEIAPRLPRDAASIDFVQYRRYDFTVKANHWKEQRYAAYLTFPLADDATNVVVERVDVGEAV